MDSRRNFIKKVGLTGVTAIVAKYANANSLLLDTETKSEKGMVILFQGDSITDGNRGRSADPNHIMGHGYAFSIASRVGADFPEKNITFYNRGISGNKITDLAQRWQSDTLDLKPDVLSILVGINDVSFAIDHPVDPVVPMFEDNYAALLDQVKAQNPNILFVLCKPFVLPSGWVKGMWDKYHTEVTKRQEIVSKLAQKYDAVLVDFQEVMDNACKLAPADYWMWDGIHPTVAGHELLTRKWISEVSKKLSFLSKYQY